MEADIKTVDRNEPISSMEPLLIPDGARHRAELNDLAFELTHKASGFRSSLPRPIQVPLAGLVRAMNCYYSNLIEGHDTHPIDIERALKNDYSQDRKTRDLQIEAKAHMAVQQWIDEGGLSVRQAVSSEGVVDLHRRFCEHLPDDLLWVDNPDTGERVRIVAGELRNRDVKVGRHVAVSPGSLPRFLARFAEVYGGLGKLDSLIAVAAAHHRLLWMHPFLDGNGRVARLMSHAMLLGILDTGAVWSVARGLARKVQEYKTLLANCDADRRNDLDGRGTLSEEALAEFTRFFLRVCIDQVGFMESLVQPDRLRARVLVWAEEEVRTGELPPQARKILEAVLHRGEVARGDVDVITGTGDRQGRRILASLIDKGVLASEGPRAPLHLAFPATLSQRWMPGLFPEQVR
jgi:Fic family protein